MAHSAVALHVYMMQRSSKTRIHGCGSKIRTQNGALINGTTFVTFRKDYGSSISCRRGKVPRLRDQTRAQEDRPKGLRLSPGPLHVETCLNRLLLSFPLTAKPTFSAPNTSPVPAFGVSTDSGHLTWSPGDRGWFDGYGSKLNR